MTASELIEFLQECVENKGNVDVIITKNNGEVYKDFEPFYYFDYSTRYPVVQLEIRE